MDVKIEDFFTPINLKGIIPEKDYQVMPGYISAADAFARTTYRSIYLADYFQRKFLYVSDNPLFLCGLTSEQVKDLGFSFYLQQVPRSDLELLLEINTAGFHFFERIPFDERMDYVVSYDFHLTQTSGKNLLINHKLTPLLLDEKGQMWVSLCIVSLSARKEAGNIEIRKKGSPIIFEFDRAKKVWHKNEKTKLNEREKEILLLSAQGLTTNEIAKEVYLSVDAIKFHRKNIFEKLSVDNITEAIMHSVSYSII
ncbi:MAG: helix-turn-helix transcriptional regulator [Sphingobacteriales bacterium 41-5]|nr:MAG: helix-turn-helix transcriptional regulator [Sphingobacteriales bacterium 41-5]